MYSRAFERQLNSDMGLKAGYWVSVAYSMLLQVTSSSYKERLVTYLMH